MLNNKNSINSNLNKAVQKAQYKAIKLNSKINRNCNCGSSNSWIECNGIDGDSNYCG